MRRAEAILAPPAPQAVTDRRALWQPCRNGLLLRADAQALPLRADCIDLTFTSPMYGAGVGYDEGGDVPPSDWAASLPPWLAELHRVTRPSGRLVLNVPLDMTIGAPRLGRAVLSRPTYHQALQAALAAGWLHKATITWDKDHHKKGNRGLGSVNSAARPHPVDPSEAIVFLTKGEWAPTSKRPDSITPAEWQEYSRGPWRFPGLPRRRGGHPAPFPEELARRCILLLSRVGDVVLDPFVGSGTTVAVAVAEGRVGVGCDRSAAYLADAALRIARVPLRLPARTRRATCNAWLPAGRRGRTHCSNACRQQAYRRRLARAGGD